MKKLFPLTLVGVLLLGACGGEENPEEENTGEDRGEEETTEEMTGEEATEEETTEDDSASATDEESAEADDESTEEPGTTETSSEDQPEDLTEAEIDEEELRSAYDIDQDKVDMVENATETDNTVDDVLKAPSEITSYIQDTSIIIEVTEGEEITDQSFQGITAEVDETDGELEVASDYFDENYEIIQPHGYGNSETDELFIYSETGWEDYSTQYGVEELIYGTYSNTHEIIEEMPDSLQVLEEGDYDILYYTGNDDVVHQLYQDTFQVEFTGADMDELELGFVAFINKESGDLESANLIASAPGQQNPEQILTIEIILNYQEYGIFDGNTEIKKPNPDDMGSTSEEGEDEGIEGSLE
ncbi:hypothetical protein WN59_12855 [Salinicoccus sediminis]|uniref:Uncharacterized protein n=1 Tax=Salinicoccus sediminis TaxID=1432562 RepID=A0A0M2SK29_9STAP|nr:hypothetical protein [Salinicoccus sediminis]KKK32930.1 hypothetical protein WN59_12855 [Salinicoccus sediminis]